ncbi:MFS transporter [Levilactobacillus wangkuiensis]|uniref:MFS transporter n=1 Tax=Levilactobacillus wangkuiensis TaxID=2799566 RepID=UPI0019434009|nr:MFS transporter [Levilactobacillus wangkuiensis]
MDVQITNRQSVIQIVKAASSDIIGTLGGDTFSFALGLMLLHTTHSAISFGLGSIIYPLVGLLLVMPVGNLVDRRRHKPLLLTSRGVALLAFVGYALLANRVSNVMALAVVVLTILACADKVTSTTYTASIHELVNDEHIKTLATIEQAATAGIQLISPVLAAALYGWIGFEGIVEVEIVAESLTWLIALSMHFHPLKATDEDEADTDKTQWQQFKVGLVFIRRHFTLFTIVTIGIFLNFLFSSIDVGLPYAIVQTRHLGNARLSWILSAFAGGVLVGNLVLSVLPRFKNVLVAVLRLAMLLGVLIGVIGGLFLVPISSFLLVASLIGISFIIGGILAFVNTPMSVYMQMTVPTKLLGRVGSTFSTLLQLALPLGTAFYGFAFQKVSAGPIYLATGIVIVVYIGVNYLAVHRHAGTEQNTPD